jgi:hypothetical protein
LPRNFLTERFTFGISIDDSWTFAGFPAPKSIIIPHLLSVNLPRGPLKIPLVKEIESALSFRDRKEKDKSSKELSAPELCKAVANRLKAAGVQFVRCWFQWNLFEPSVKTREEKEEDEEHEIEESLKFPLDNFVNAMKAESIEILGVVGNGYARFLPEGLNTDDPDQYLRRLEISTKQILRHYKDSVSTWQIENEPNWWEEHFAVGWRKGGIWFKPEIREAVLKTLQGTVRAECPNATLVINLEVDRRNVDWKAWTRYCDVLGLDFYPNYSHADPVDASMLKICSEARSEAGIPVFVSETGYPSGPSIMGYNEKNQAQYIKDACELSFASDSINAISVWRYQDTYWRSFPDQENHFGLITEDGREKEAWSEYANQIALHSHE